MTYHSPGGVRINLSMGDRARNCLKVQFRLVKIGFGIGPSNNYFSSTANLFVEKKSQLLEIFLQLFFNG